MTSARPYVYRGSGRSLTPKEAAEAEAKRNGIDPRPRPRPATPTAVPELRGAVKVTGFPEPPTVYPFEQIAADGGVWKIDPAEFTAKIESIRKMACTWAKDHGLKPRTALDGGYLYVQFSKGEK